MYRKNFSYLVFLPNNLKVEALEEEKQNEKYGGAVFKLSLITIRFRIAQTTPKKTGQFVAFWEKDENNKNRAYHYDDSPDLLVVNCFGNNNKFGQFVFPKAILLKQGILRTDFKKGKMGIRVYPRWDNPESETALKTQAWQAKYFIEGSNKKETSSDKILKLYYQE